MEYTVDSASEKRPVCAVEVSDLILATLALQGEMLISKTAITKKKTALLKSLNVSEGHLNPERSRKCSYHTRAQPTHQL